MLSLKRTLQKVIILTLHKHFFIPPQDFEKFEWGKPATFFKIGMAFFY